MRTARSQFLMMLIVGVVVAGVTARAESLLIALDNPAIVIDDGLPSYVRHAVEDLAGYLREITGTAVPIGSTRSEKGATTIVVGPKEAEQVLGVPMKAAELGEQGYVLKGVRKDGESVVVAAGNKPQGTNAAVYALMREIIADRKRALVNASLDITSRPSFAIRGLHFNGWPFSYPHSFRRWSEKEWQNYLDIMAYQGINLFFFWPFMEIMPLPLSPEDKTYLEECKRVVDYAQKKHGMEVWIMQCTNRVANGNCGVVDPKARPYWRMNVQEDLNPADPKNFEKIVASREALYRAMDNVDGVVNIDSDPGYCPNCPLEDYVKMLKAFRSLLDKYNVHGKQAKLMSWMWMGWGKTHKDTFNAGHQERTLDVLQKELGDGWGPMPGKFGFLDLCRKQGLLDRSVLIPYGMIEDEPSYPTTNVGKKNLREVIEADFTRNLDMPGAIGNVQTPLLQLPNIYYFEGCLRDINYRKTPEKDVLLELAGHLYPEHRQLIADCYLGLKSRDAAKSASLANELDALVRADKLGRSGIIGRKLFPDHRVVAQALVLQLRLKSATEHLFQDVTPTSTQAECAKLMTDCLDAYLAWDTTHGWHELWGWQAARLVPILADPRKGDMVRQLAKALKDKTAVDACLAQVTKSLTAKYDAKSVQQGCIEPLSSAILGIIANTAARAKTTASVVPDPGRYPPSNANDGQVQTLYWPGALVNNNTEWYQLEWETPQVIKQVVAKFMQHPSMYGRTIHLQHEKQPGKWVDLATAVVPDDAKAPYAVATFKLDPPVFRSEDSHSEFARPARGGGSLRGHPETLKTDRLEAGPTRVSGCTLSKIERAQIKDHDDKLLAWLDQNFQFQLTEPDGGDPGLWKAVIYRIRQ